VDNCTVLGSLKFLGVGQNLCRHKDSCTDACQRTCIDGIRNFGFVCGGWMELAKDCFQLWAL
jgi:hypothetical protein